MLKKLRTKTMPRNCSQNWMQNSVRISLLKNVAYKSTQINPADSSPHLRKWWSFIISTVKTKDDRWT